MEKNVEFVIPLNQNSRIPNLLKYCIQKEIESLLTENTQKATADAIAKSVTHQVMCKKTGYICRIK